jgi:hypothetical protein
MFQRGSDVTGRSQLLRDDELEQLETWMKRLTTADLIRLYQSVTDAVMNRREEIEAIGKALDNKPAESETKEG